MNDVLKNVHDLTPSEREEIRQRTANEKDFGITDWERLDQGFRHVFALFIAGRFVGMCSWSDGPGVDEFYRSNLYLWLHGEERGKHHGSAMVKLLIPAMEARGVRGLAPMLIQATGKDFEPANALGARLRAHFPLSNGESSQREGRG